MWIDIICYRKLEKPRCPSVGDRLIWDKCISKMEYYVKKMGEGEHGGAHL
jgi:hypothetical protein